MTSFNSSLCANVFFVYACDLILNYKFAMIFGEYLYRLRLYGPETIVVTRGNVNYRMKCEMVGSITGGLLVPIMNVTF